MTYSVGNVPSRDRRTMQFECGIHDLTYKSHAPGCPVCGAEREMTNMRAAMLKLRNQLEQVTDESNRMRVQVDVMAAIREAAQILDDEDLAFLKSVLYEWRDAKSLQIKTTHGARKAKRQPAAANGFIVIPRKGDPYGHICSSMGGLAIASYFDEATNSVGPAKAMEYLVKGMSEHLPGAVT